MAAYRAQPSTYWRQSTSGWIRKTKASVRVRVGVFGYQETMGYWIGCCMKDLPLFVSRLGLFYIISFIFISVYFFIQLLDSIWELGLQYDRSFGWEMRNLFICTRRGWEMLDTSPSNLQEPTIAEMVRPQFWFIWNRKTNHKQWDW